MAEPPTPDHPDADRVAALLRGDRDAFVASGMVSGVTDGYLALDKILAS
mgnify:CR=1 FL=1